MYFKLTKNWSLAFDLSTPFTQKGYVGLGAGCLYDHLGFYITIDLLLFNVGIGLEKEIDSEVPEL